MPSMIEYENLIQEIEITDLEVVVKFTRTVKLSTITNDKFTITNKNLSTGVANPFLAINLTDDYNSIGRILRLYWTWGRLSSDINSVMPSNTDYRFKISGLQDASNTIIPDEWHDFHIGDYPFNPDAEDGILSSDTNVVVHDFSIKTPSSDFSIRPGSGNFYITEADPSSGEYYIDTDYHNGRVTIKFSSNPQAEFINSTFFRGQRKKIQRAPARWETLNVRVSKNSVNPSVYVDFPSLDITPVYDTIGSDYFESNYKYRILVSKDVSS